MYAQRALERASWQGVAVRAEDLELVGPMSLALFGPHSTILRRGASVLHANMHTLVQ